MLKITDDLLGKRSSKPEHSLSPLRRMIISVIIMALLLVPVSRCSTQSWRLEFAPPKGHEHDVGVFAVTVTAEIQSATWRTDDTYGVKVMVTLDRIGANAYVEMNDLSVSVKTPAGTVTTESASPESGSELGDIGNVAVYNVDLLIPSQDVDIAEGQTTEANLNFYFTCTEHYEYTYTCWDEEEEEYVDLREEDSKGYTSPTFSVSIRIYRPTLSSSRLQGQ